MERFWLGLRRFISQELHALDRDTRTILGICLAVLLFIGNFLFFIAWAESKIKPPVMMTLFMMVANGWLAGAGLYSSYDTWKEIRGFRVTPRETTGRVVDVRSSYWDDVGDVYIPFIKYEAEGHVYVLRHHLYSTHVNRYKLGDTYRLVYWSERPEQAEFYPYPVWKKAIKSLLHGLSGVIASGSLLGFLYLLFFTK